jgi:hypothetical protein
MLVQCGMDVSRVRMEIKGAKIKVCPSTQRTDKKYPAQSSVRNGRRGHIAGFTAGTLVASYSGWPVAVCDLPIQFSAPGAAPGKPPLFQKPLCGFDGVRVIEKGIIPLTPPVRRTRPKQPGDVSASSCGNMSACPLFTASQSCKRPDEVYTVKRRGNGEDAV